MPRSIRVVQITDCHLPADKLQQYRGINPHVNLERLLAVVKKVKPDVLLASGDLSEDASQQSYRVLRQLFSTLHIPILALPGNHDDPELLARTFTGSPVDHPEVTNHGDWQIIRLNSCLEGRPEGQLSEPTIDSLQQILSENAGLPALIALHHQPVSVGSPWIDKYSLNDPEPFLKLTGLYPRVKLVVWGHVHQVYAQQRGGSSWLAGPSSAINSMPGVNKFTEDPAGPACRWLDLFSDGTMQTGIYRLVKYTG